MPEENSLSKSERAAIRRIAERTLKDLTPHELALARAALVKFLGEYSGDPATQTQNG